MCIQLNPDLLLLVLAEAEATGEKPARLPPDRQKKMATISRQSLNRHLLKLAALVAGALILGQSAVAWAEADGPTPPPADIVSWWPGDADPNDVAGSNDGVPMNGAKFAAGKVGQAFSLDGIDDFVQVSDAANLDITDGITVDAWIKPAYSQIGAIVAKIGADNGTATGYGLIFRGDAGPRGLIEAYAGKDGSFYGVGSSSPIPLNRFTHVALTYDGDALNVYVNGELDGSSSTSGPITPNDVSLTIGATTNRGTMIQFFSGVIDEVDIFERALSEDEIEDVYDAGSAGKSRSTSIVVPAGDSGAVVGEPYSQTLTALLGTPPYAFTLSSGSLPPGLSLSRTGRITGTPSEVGLFDFTVTVTDKAGYSGEAEISIRVVATVDPASDLLSWWPANGDAKDAADGNDGVTVNGATFAAGKVGQAFRLDGRDDFVQVSDTANLDITDQITIDAWIRPTKSQIGAIVAKFGADNGSATSYGLIFRGDAGPRGMIEAYVGKEGGLYTLLPTTRVTSAITARTDIYRQSPSCD